MKTKQTYTFGPVTYGFAGKWRFKVGKFQLIAKCPGGKVVADKVARALAGSYKRTGDEFLPLDGLGRWTISNLTKTVVEED